MAGFATAPVTTAPGVKNMAPTASPNLRQVAGGFGVTQSPSTAPAVSQQQAVAARLGQLSPEQSDAFHAWIAGHMVAGTAPTAGGVAQPHPLAGIGGTGGASPTELPAATQNAYQSQMNTANTTADTSLANNVFQQNATRQSYAPLIAQQQYTQQQQRIAEPDSFVGRGVIGSGIEHQGFQNLAEQQGVNNATLYGGLATKLQGLQAAHQTIENNRRIALQNIETNRQAALAAFAATQVK